MPRSGKIVVLLTGANQGIGYETAKNLVHSSAAYHVILGSRDISKGKAAIQALLQAEVGTGVKTAKGYRLLGTSRRDGRSVHRSRSRACGSRLRQARRTGEQRRHHLDRTSPPTAQALRRVLETNVVGALAVTEAFLDLLRMASEHRPPRLVFVSSSMGSITHAADATSPYENPHGTCKAALNMLMTMYSARLKPEGILVIGADPGLCATNITGDAASLRNRGAAEPADGGNRVATVVKGEKDVDAGKVVGVYGVSPW